MDIYETAHTLIDLALLRDAPAIRMFRTAVAQARSLIRQRNEIKAQAYERLRHSRDYQILGPIPGIGSINALTIIAEVATYAAFIITASFSNCAGWICRHTNRASIGARPDYPNSANARLRRTLCIAGQVAFRQRENGFRHRFERYIARDRDDPDLRRKAMTGVTTKMARVVPPSSKAVQIIGPSLKGGYQVEAPLSVRAVKASATVLGQRDKPRSRLWNGPPLSLSFDMMLWCEQRKERAYEHSDPWN